MDDLWVCTVFEASHPLQDLGSFNPYAALFARCILQTVHVVDFQPAAEPLGTRIRL